MADAIEGSGLLSSHRIHSLPPSFYYIPNFISVKEETRLLEQIPPNRWITLSHRRLQAHPSKLTSNNILLDSPLPSFLTDPIHDQFADLAVFKDTPHWSPNHVLLNEYKPGEGIMMHEDGAAYAPVVATVSLGASIVLDLIEKTHQPEQTSDRRGRADVAELENGGTTAPARYRILQESRSLLVTTGQAYTNFLHGITEVERDEDLGPNTIVNWEFLGNREQFESGAYERETRISLTYRDVLKVSKVGSKILGLGKK